MLASWEMVFLLVLNGSALDVELPAIVYLDQVIGREEDVLQQILVTIFGYSAKF